MFHYICRIDQGPETAPDRDLDVRRLGKRPEQKLVQGDLRTPPGQPEWVPHLGHFLHLTRVDGLRPGPKLIRGRTRNRITLNLVSSIPF